VTSSNRACQDSSNLSATCFRQNDLSQTDSRYLDISRQLEPGRRPVRSWLSTTFRPTCDTYTTRTLRSMTWRGQIPLCYPVRELVLVADQLARQIVSWIAQWNLALTTNVSSIIRELTSHTTSTAHICTYTAV